ncbi:hypothetical protein HYH03_000286 [Edaphochlamys debaryana]|uniref:Uncharacterized protein n=1 Tax=Edaphochlamys debaryana TaxID=47281 RepID=A0A835YIX6_9CHLO|nr:hypothetical protein HYH03_000286 [Edaphochlamys debaryana]|eukprot:KAG2501786.1 hypothetical protein HYH03_000286 [Edaphochlamys debaryana]
MTGVSRDQLEDAARLMMGRSYDELKPHEKGAVIGSVRKHAGQEAAGGLPSTYVSDGPRPQHMGKIIR